MPEKSIERALLPCPFCGNPSARLEEGEFGYQVSCEPKEGCAAVTDYQATPALAIKAWNRRHSGAPQPVACESQGPETSDEETPFGRAIGDYARACWHHEMAGMRSGYVKLRDLFAAQFVGGLTAHVEPDGKGGCALYVRSGAAEALRPDEQKESAQEKSVQPADERMTDEQIIEIRDAHLPNQGERFDCIAFARAIESAARAAIAPTKEPK